MEIYKTIKNYDDYEVSNYGNVKSTKFGKNRILKPALNSKKRKGYLAVALLKDGKQKTLPIHKLVAEAFVPNIDNKPQINHINGIKTDNNSINLEWVTPSENIKHAWDNKLFFGATGKPNKSSTKFKKGIGLQAKKVKLTNLITKEVFIFDSAKETAKFINRSPSYVSSICIKKCKPLKDFDIIYIKD